MREPEDLLEREKARGVVYAERDCGDARDGEDPAQDLNGGGASCVSGGVLTHKTGRAGMGGWLRRMEAPPVSPSGHSLG